MAPKIQVLSETGLLDGVIVHTPGREVSLVSPEIKDNLLFDDIIFEEDARVEHIEMMDIIRTAIPGVPVVQITDLIRETFQNSEAREYFVDAMARNLPDENIRIAEKALLGLSAGSLTNLAVLGETPELKNFRLYPSPNILFTRDLAAVVGDNVIISRAAKKARFRESIMMSAVVQYHPMYKEVRDRVFHIPAYESVEGGDILAASDKVALIGMSERTSFSGLMRTGEMLLDNGLEHILIVDIPKQRSSMHLDTIFTFSDTDECIAYPPAIIDRTDNVVSLVKENGKIITELKPSLKVALDEAMNRNYRFIPCGGSDPVSQQREQWSDGANVFCLAPGVIIGYERNIHTFKEMEKSGYKIISGKEFIESYKGGTFDIRKAGKMAITFEGHELCRGRGGARCMTQPFSRRAGWEK